jgi:hypothetical protein
VDKRKGQKQMKFPAQFSAVKRWQLAFAAIGIAFLGATPAWAIDINACTAAVGTLEIRPDADIIITANDPDGTYESTQAVRVYCVKPGGVEELITGATIQVMTFDNPGAPIAEFEIMSEGSAYLPSNLALVALTDLNQDAYYTFSIRSNSDDLASGPTPVDVGAYLQFTFGNFNFTAEGANILASVQTPELSSIALFASGATGMLGYALARARKRENS